MQDCLLPFDTAPIVRQIIAGVKYGVCNDPAAIKKMEMIFSMDADVSITNKIIKSLEDRLRDLEEWLGCDKCGICAGANCPRIKGCDNE